MTPDAIQDEITHPPRCWWLKRIGLASALVALLLLGVRIVWGSHSQKVVQRALAELRSRGEPVSVKDLEPPPIADEENAATWLNRAAAISTNVLSPRNDNLSYTGPPFPAEWWAAAEASHNVHSAIFPLLREAGLRPRSVWRSGYTSPLWNTAMPTMSAQRTNATITVDEALYRHMTGDDAAALDLTLDGLRHADAIDQEPLLVPHLVAVGIRALVCGNVMTIAPGLGAPAPGRKLIGTPVPATRQQILALVAYLLDDDAAKGWMADSMRTERVGFIDGIQTLLGQSVILRPAFELDLADGAGMYDSLVAAAQADSWPAAKAALGQRWPARPTGRISQMMRRVLMPGLERAVQTDFRCRFGRRGAAISLAANLFRRENGRWPASLEQLVPGYLPAVPIDPFDPGGKPIGYVLIDGVRPIITSVGENGAPEPDLPARISASPNYSWIASPARSQKDDQYFDLSCFAFTPATGNEDN